MTVPRQVQRTIGLMSGTSLDGIDVAYLESDGYSHVVAGPAMTFPYADDLRCRLRDVLGGVGPVPEVERAMTEAHAAAVERFVETHRLAADLIGFHGHTILHRPEIGRTWQIGDGALLARLTGCDVVCDFRSSDVAAGGEGAPLVPLYHAALAAALLKPLAILNLGGVANLTWLGDAADAILAFDTGPGNAPIDDWALRHRGEAVDRGGAMARAGRVDAARLAAFLTHPFFDRAPPKSLDRNDFLAGAADGLTAEDGAATLTAMTAAAVARGAAYCPAPPRRFLVTGGGRHNPVLMAELASRLGAPVAPVETVGWDGDALEAQAFAFLAVRSRAGLPLSLPSTTGVARPVSGGRFFAAAASPAAG
ncbi:MAG: Anhydro-N-acetylmuramic acid kinase [Rhodospirillales bacterium]|nr:Anhydro-N-acetylmuramic acid kinase [Rhodospirillales bacterium]